VGERLIVIAGMGAGGLDKREWLKITSVSVRKKVYKVYNTY
jgi:hypothetical protein